MAGEICDSVVNQGSGNRNGYHEQTCLPVPLFCWIMGSIIANVRKLLLTHFYPECGEVDIEKECRKTYSGDLILAEDFMTVDFG